MSPSFLILYTPFSWFFDLFDPSFLQNVTSNLANLFITSWTPYPKFGEVPPPWRLSQINMKVISKLTYVDLFGSYSQGVQYNLLRDIFCMHYWGQLYWQVWINLTMTKYVNDVTTLVFIHKSHYTILPSSLSVTHSMLPFFAFGGWDFWFQDYFRLVARWIVHTCARHR